MLSENYDEVRRQPMEARQSVINTGIALIIPMILWSILGFCLAHVALGYPLIPSLITAIACSTIIYLIEKLILTLPSTTVWMTIARFSMAIAISFVGGIGLETMIYGKDEDRLIKEIDNAKIASLDSLFDVKNSDDRQTYSRIINTVQRKQDSLLNLYIDELQGRGSKLGGNGPIAKALKVQLDTCRNGVILARKSLANLDQTYQARKLENRKQYSSDNGIQLRMNLLFRIVSESWHSILFFIALQTLLLGLELITLAVKVSLKKTTLDRKRDFEQEVFKRNYSF